MSSRDLFIVWRIPTSIYFSNDKSNAAEAGGLINNENKMTASQFVTCPNNFGELAGFCPAWVNH